MTYIQPTGGGGTVVNVRNYYAGQAPAGGFEVPSTLPTLTWAFGSAQVLTSTTSVDDFMAAFRAALAADGSGWIEKDYVSAGTERTLLIAGPAGSPVKDMRIVGAVSTATALDAAAVFTTTYFSEVGAPAFTYAPSAPTINTVAALGNFWNGGGQAAFLGTRESKFSSCTRDIPVTGIDSVALWTTDENMLVIMPVGGINRVMFLGATITPPSDDAAEADGRVYGIHGSCRDGLNATCHSDDRRWPGTFSFVVATGSESRAFRPGAPATQDLLLHVEIQGSSVTNQLGVTPPGPRFGTPTVLYQVAGVFNSIGWLRQISAIKQGTHGDPLTDKDGGAVGMTLSQTAGGNNNAYAVTNIGNQG